jgi:hypothetical protein
MKKMLNKRNITLYLIKEFLDALHRSIENRHSREGVNPEERKSGFRIKCGMTTCNGHFQLLIPRSSALGFQYNSLPIEGGGLGWGCFVMIIPNTLPFIPSPCMIEDRVY